MCRPSIASTTLRAAAVVLSVVACSRDVPAPTAATAPRAEIAPPPLVLPTPLKEAAGTPAVEIKELTFVATKGVASDVIIKYGKNATHPETQIFAQLTIPPLALKTRPGGTPINIGDKVEITIKVVDQTKFLVQLLPSGLKFDTRYSPLIALYYVYADLDFNGDGDLDVLDQNIEKKLRVWKQEFQQPFQRLEGTPDLQLGRVRGALNGFSNLIVAY